jgi:hypothetical protein
MFGLGVVLAGLLPGVELRLQWNKPIRSSPIPLRVSPGFAPEFRQGKRQKNTTPFTGKLDGQSGSVDREVR